jgi:hypothetical protein
MQIPEIGTPLSLLAVPIFLWFWTLRHAKAKLFHQEIILSKQSRRASWSYVFCLTFQILAILYPKSDIVRIIISFSCFLLTMLFLLSSYRNGTGFWAKRRNQVIGGSILLTLYLTTSTLLADLFVVPLISAFAIASIYQRRFLSMFSASLRDVEALKIKLLRQEASYHNNRQASFIEN